MSPNDTAELAKRIAEEEIGGPPTRCTGHKADRYNAAYNAVVKAVDASIRKAAVAVFVVENTDGAFVASFSTKFLADFFVDEGGGCYRHRHEGAGHG